MENWTDNPRDRQDLAETPKDSAGRQGERWKRPEEKRCCFLCGSHAHIKKDCSQYRGPTGTVGGFPVLWLVTMLLVFKIWRISLEISGPFM